MTDIFMKALATAPQGFVDVVDMAAGMSEGEDLPKWLTTPQGRWEGKSPLDMIAADKADDVLDMLEGSETYL